MNSNIEHHEGASKVIASSKCKLDTDEYMDDLHDFDLTDSQKVELLQALWHIMGILVDIGYGVDAVQYLLPDFFEKSSRDSHELVEKKNS